jgi:O-antigen/teichoic acid export membrane protein
MKGRGNIENGLILASGNLISQALPILILPILTRIYSPSEFGVYSFYQSLITILAVFCCARYDQAILLAHKNTTSKNLLTLSLLMNLAYALLVFVGVLIVFNLGGSEIIGKESNVYWIVIIPMMIIITGTVQATNIWLNRNKKYLSLSSIRLLQVAAVNLMQLLLGYIGKINTGLWMGDFLGKLLPFIVAIRLLTKEAPKLVRKKNYYKQLAIRYIKFPLYDGGGALVNSVANQMQGLYFPLYFGLSEAGGYFLAIKILSVPVSFVSATISEIFRQKLAETQRDPVRLRKYYINMLIGLLIVSAPSYLLFLMYGNFIISLILGDSWLDVFAMMEIMAPMYLIRFIASPLSYYLYIKEKQHVDFYGNIAFLILGLYAMLSSNNIFDSIRIMSIGFGCVYLMYIIYSAYLAKVICIK